jgi:hypothetical protein
MRPCQTAYLLPEPAPGVLACPWAPAFLKQRLLGVCGFLPATGLPEGGRRRVARVLRVLPMQELCNGQNLDAGKGLVREVFRRIGLNIEKLSYGATCGMSQP